MPRLLSILLVLLFLPAGLASTASWGDPFESHMVLPMGRPIPVWGNARPLSTVRVRFGSASVPAKCDAKGHWQLTLPPQPANTRPQTLELIHAEGSLLCSDVLVGRVWCFTGQSNMDFPLRQATGGGEALRQAADFPQIRYRNLSTVTTLSRAYSAADLDRLRSPAAFEGSWQSPLTTPPADLSAIAWWTAAEAVRLDPDTPIGIVEHAVGGSGTESWIPRDALARLPDSASLLGPRWLEDRRLSPWARERARLNLGSHPDAPHPFQPSFNFEHAVAPWRNFPLDAVIWYQGETNAEIPDRNWNGLLLRTLIEGWRRRLEQPGLPFFLIELPRIGGKDPLRAHWPAYREVQRLTARSLPHTRLLPTTDLGYDSPDVHPPDKFPIARRLAPLLQRNSPSGLKSQGHSGK